MSIHPYLEAQREYQNFIRDNVHNHHTPADWLTIITKEYIEVHNDLERHFLDYNGDRISFLNEYKDILSGQIIEFACQYLGYENQIVEHDDRMNEYIYVKVGEHNERFI